MDQESHEQKLELLRAAAFGRMVEEFWATDIGKFLLLHASACYSSAIAELKTLPPTDASGIMRAQGAAWQAENFKLWLGEAIKMGADALDLLEGNTDDDVPQD